MSVRRIEAQRFRVQSVVQDAFQWADGRNGPLIGLSLVAGTVTFALEDLFGHLARVDLTIHVLMMSAVFIIVVRHRFPNECVDVFYPVRVLRIAGWFLIAAIIAGEVFTSLIAPLVRLEIPPITTIGLLLIVAVAASYIFARVVPKLVAISLGLDRSFLGSIGMTQGAGWRIIYGSGLVAVLPTTAILMNEALLFLITGSRMGAQLGFLVVVLQWLGNVLYFALLAIMAAFMAEAYRRLRELNGDVD